MSQGNQHLPDGLRIIEIRCQQIDDHGMGFFRLIFRSHIPLCIMAGFIKHPGCMNMVKRNIVFFGKILSNGDDRLGDIELLFKG